MQIINTYAPHMGYDKDEQIKYWGDIKELLQNTNQKQCKIWATDNNGQIAQNINDIENKTIGKWATSHKTETGNGQILAKTCKKYALCATNTHFIPHKMDKRHLNTWHNKEDGTYKQLDYMMISNKQKNWVTQVRTRGTANPSSAHRRQLLRNENTDTN